MTIKQFVLLDDNKIRIELIMEDGMLMAPAPYSSPAAYYFPTAGRMNSCHISINPFSNKQISSSSPTIISIRRKR